MTTPYQSKSKKNFNAPTLFVNPQSVMDLDALKKVITDSPDDSANIEGIVFSLKDWQPLQTTLNQLSLINQDKIDNKIRILDPALPILFQGYSTDKTSIMNIEIDGGKKIGDYQLITGGLRLRDVVDTIGSLEKSKSKEKGDRYVRDVYPYMDLLVNPIIKYGIENKFDIIANPSIPVTNSHLLPQQIEQIRKMNRTGKILADTLFAKEMEKRDLMFLLTANMSVIKQENYDDLISTLIIRDEKTDEVIVPDQIGIRLANEDNNVEAIQSFLDFISRLARTLKNQKLEIPIHIFNVREFGYVCFSYGATTITSPIATQTAIHRSVTGGFITADGKYYHPIDMLDYRYEKLLAFSRGHNYTLPCHCKACEREKSLIKAKDRWNQFRREHFLYAKHLEIKEIKEAPSNVLNRHLQQKFSRSKQTNWLAVLDQQPILTFN